MRQAMLKLGLLCAAGVLYYARFIEPNQLEIIEETLTLPRLDSEFDGYRIVQISDIHFDSWMSRSRLEAIVHQVNCQNPDLIVITGDFVSYHIKYSVDDLTAALRLLSARDGVVAVPGNHDYFSGIEIIRQIMRTCGILDLSNYFCTLQRGESLLHIAGIDDVYSRMARLDLLLDMLPPEGAVILLAHAPDFVDVAAPTGRFDLQISGHTHGGQIRLPIIGTMYGPAHGVRYSAGLYDVDGMPLYVNRGLGMVTIPVRFNCHPEISVFTLKSAG